MKKHDESKIASASDWLAEMQQWTEAAIAEAGNNVANTWAQRAAAKRLIVALSDRRTNDGAPTGGDDFYKITAGK